MNRAQKSMLIDLLCYLHASGNCRLYLSRAEAALMLGLSKDEQQEFELVWKQFVVCPDDENAWTHPKMWEWYLSDQLTSLKRQNAGRKGGQAKIKPGLSRAKANGKQTLYDSDSNSVSISENKNKVIQKRFKPPILEQCIEYFVANGSTKSEAEKFFYFYDSKNWKVGKNKMSRWRSAAAGWIRKTEDGKESRKPVTFQQSKEERTKEILRKAFE
tara:strand:+ start:130 stop:774 length:645 start_codon:yes stop_codon:yes gene_type:complete